MPSTPTARVCCRICHAAEDAPVYRAREMMFGTREEFEYFQCEACGCIQIRDIPEDLSRFYAGYGSLDLPPPPPGGLHGWLKAHRERYTFTGRGVIGRLASAFRPYPTHGVERWLARPGVSVTSRILDVGGGAGHLLLDLQTAGYQNLLGVDPFLPHDVCHPGGVKALRRSIHELEGTFDVVMLHHVIEHVPDQHETLASVARLLSDDGFCLIRTPNASSEAWETYRQDWAQLDPPRHLFVHSVRSLERLARGAGLQVESVEFDSTEFQFVASELYLQDVPLVEQHDPVSWRKRRQLRRRALRLNAAGRGDQAAFYLRRARSREPLPGHER